MKPHAIGLALALLSLGADAAELRQWTVRTNSGVIVVNTNGSQGKPYWVTLASLSPPQQKYLLASAASFECFAQITAIRDRLDSLTSIVALKYPRDGRPAVVPEDSAIKALEASLTSLRAKQRTLDARMLEAQLEIKDARKRSP